MANNVPQIPEVAASSVDSYSTVTNKKSQPLNVQQFGWSEGGTGYLLLDGVLSTLSQCTKKNLLPNVNLLAFYYLISQLNDLVHHVNSSF